MRLGAVCVAFISTSVLVSACHKDAYYNSNAGGKSWTFAMTGRRRPYSYIDEKGNLAGFDVDIATAVCRVAGEACENVQKDSSACGTSQGGTFVPGKELLEGSIDACAGQVITADRLQYFSFTEPYYTSRTYFHVKDGNPLGFDESNVSGKRIAYLDGTYTNGDCMKRLGFSGFLMVPGKGLQAVLNLVNSEQVDALFAPRREIPGVQRASEKSYDCSLGGGAMMVRKDSHLPDWYNLAFKSLVASGQYQQICDESPQKHGGSVNCFED